MKKVIAFCVCAQLADTITTLMPGGYETVKVSAFLLRFPLAFIAMKMVLIPAILIGILYGFRNNKIAYNILAIGFIAISVPIFYYAITNITVI